MKINVSEIEWDTDGEVVDLPKEISMDLDCEDRSDKETIGDAVADWLSDEYGWCVNEFLWDFG